MDWSGLIDSKQDFIRILIHQIENNSFIAVLIVDGTCVSYSFKFISLLVYLNLTNFTILYLEISNLDCFRCDGNVFFFSFFFILMNHESSLLIHEKLHPLT